MQYIYALGIRGGVGARRRLGLVPRPRRLGSGEEPNRPSGESPSVARSAGKEVLVHPFWNNSPPCRLWESRTDEVFFDGAGEL